MAKTQMSDGKGGFIEIEATPFAVKQTIKDKKRQDEIHQQAQAEAQWKRIDAATKRFNAMEKAYGTENGLSEEEMFAAKYLDLLNWQHFFPKELGGPPRTIQICTVVQEWFLEQLKG